MNILLLSPLPPPSGGIARWTERYTAWCKTRAEVTVVNTAVSGQRIQQAGAPKRLIDEACRAIRILSDTHRAIRQGHFDVMHLNTSCSNVGVFRDLLCARQAYKAGISIVVQCHCNIEDQLGNNRFARKAFKEISDNAAYVLTLNRSSLAYVQQVSKTSTGICPNFLLREQMAEQHSIQDQLRTVVYVGDVCISKGSRELLEAAAMLPEVQFRLIGSVAQEIADMDCPTNATFVGRLEQEEVKRELDNADVFVFPSYSEGFSQALLEAMARGLPVVASDVGANRDMIEDKGGIILDRISADVIVQALNRIEKPQVRANMSAWNIRKVQQTYDYDATMHNLMNLYEKVCHDKTKN